jgi:hypothetical protein
MRSAGTGAEFHLEVEHTVKYSGCELRDRDPDTRVTRLKSARHYINYEGKGQDVLRYISTATVVPLGEEEDPCR